LEKATIARKPVENVCVYLCLFYEIARIL